MQCFDILRRDQSSVMVSVWQSIARSQPWATAEPFATLTEIVWASGKLSPMADEIKTNFHAMQLLHQAQVYMPSVVPGLGRGGFYVFSAAKVLGHGDTIQEAMEAAGYWPLPDGFDLRPIYSAEGYDIQLGSQQVAIAKSKTLAKRIANALNEYSPNERGF
jgi:hypothetical protein